MMSKLNNINSWDWWNNQPVNKWLNIKDIPYSVFNTIWNIKIESCNVKIHPFEAKYKINIKY